MVDKERAPMHSALTVGVSNDALLIRMAFCQKPVGFVVNDLVSHTAVYYTLDATKLSMPHAFQLPCKRPLNHSGDCRPDVNVEEIKYVLGSDTDWSEAAHLARVR